jgi:hypothetical protein
VPGTSLADPYPTPVPIELLIADEKLGDLRIGDEAESDIGDEALGPAGDAAEGDAVESAASALDLPG